MTRRLATRARLFLEAALEAIDDLRRMGKCGNTSELQWPDLLKEFTEDGGFRDWDSNSVASYIKYQLDTDPEGLNVCYFSEEE